MGLIWAVHEVFNFFSSFYSCLPVAIKLLIVGTFGLFLLVGLFQCIKG